MLCHLLFGVFWKSHFVDQTGLWPIISLPQSTKCWGYECAPSHWANAPYCCLGLCCLLLPIIWVCHKVPGPSSIRGTYPTEKHKDPRFRKVCHPLSKPSCSSSEMFYISYYITHDRYAISGNTPSCSLHKLIPNSSVSYRGGIVLDNHISEWLKRCCSNRSHSETVSYR